MSYPSSSAPPPYEEIQGIPKVHHGQQPIVTQPGLVAGPTVSAGWSTSAPYAESTIGCPPGLEALLPLNKVLVSEQFVGWVTGYVLSIMDPTGMRIYVASADRQCCAPMGVTVQDGYNQEVLYLATETECASQALRVECPQGYPIARVEVDAQCCYPSSYVIKYPDGRPVFSLEPPEPSCCSRVQTYKVVSHSGGVEVGNITWLFQWSTPDHFTLNFPQDLDVKMKASLIGACVLLDLLMHRRRRNSRR